ncbi:superoxide dismutase [Salinithrix halophila]|uniref:superoxide dismutase n=1 Tax=Salinithrix halophila TaxID=1485204 RepID=A0ABV8JI31_9BACL
MISYFDPNGEQVRWDIRHFAQHGRKRIDDILTDKKSASETVLKQGRSLSRHLRRLEKEASVMQPHFLSHLIQQAQKIRYQLEEWLEETSLVTSAALNGEEPDTGETAGEGGQSQEGNVYPPLRPVPIGKHTLPPLPYPYDALEPHIDAKTMRLHHDEHHKSYVEGLNKAERMMARARRTGDFDLIKHWEREAAFNGAGHYLHTLFWETMSPQGGGKPTGKLASQIQRDFGGFDAFKKHFSAAAEKVEGGGWAILVWAPRAHHLEILQAEKHQNLSQWDVIPLLPLDVWEHAYYLKYPNKRKKYIQAWWNVVNWPEVSRRFQEARKVAWKPY